MRRAILLQFVIFVLSLFPQSTKALSYNVKEISHLEINSAITPATYDYLKYQFKSLPTGSLILIKINTPGGLISTTKDIITLIGAQDKPVAIWVTPEGASAASAGAIIAASAHFILMSTGTNIGAATPVGLGEDIKESDGRSKALNDLKAMVRSLSYSRNRPSAPFEKMIDKAESYTDQEALKEKFIDGVINQDQTLSKILNGKKFVLLGKEMDLILPANTLSKDYEATAGQKLLNVLANPSTAYFIFLLGVALLYFELQAPGGYIAGGIGIAFIILAAISFQVLPLDWGALALIITGVILLILEIYVTSYGLLGLGGIVSFIIGSLFLFHGEGGYISVDYPVLISTLIGVVSCIGFLTWYLIRDQKKQNLKQQFFLPLGAKGNVLTVGHNSYQIKVKGEIWRASSSDILMVGDSIEVINIDPEKLIAVIKKTAKE